MVVAVEEEFDWDGPLPPARTLFRHAEDLAAALDRFERHAVRPVLLATQRAVDDPDCARLLRERSERGLAEVGAHLHPWVSEPHAPEERDPAATFPGNLTRSLERAKIRALTERLAGLLGSPPASYQAGRYGLGPRTWTILREAGYRVSLSAMPAFDYSAEGGPDYSRLRPTPRIATPFDGEGAPDPEPLVEIPIGGAFVGALSSAGAALHGLASLGPLKRLRAPGLLARLRLVERMRLTPEGMDLSDMERLARHLLRRGERVLALAIHSPSLRPGGSPYAPDARARDALVERTVRFVERARERWDARTCTALEAREVLLRRARREPRP